MKTKKIIKVVNFIEDYCKSTICCTNCILGANTDFCPFYENPKRWNTKQIKANLKDIERI